MPDPVQPLVSIVYASDAAPGFGSDDLRELLTASRSHNRDSRVTGMLLAEHGRFLQAIEGPEKEVRALFALIAADPRHRDVRVLADEVLRQRRFPDWAMANGHLGDVDAQPLAMHFAVLTAARQALPVPVPQPLPARRRGLLARLTGR